MPGVELSTSACNGHVVVALRGDLDITGAADAGAAITSLVIPGRCLIIDMSALDFIDCGSLSALLRVQWLAWSADGDVALAAPQRRALRLLALTGRDHAFLIHASVQAAAAALPGRRWPAAFGEHCTLWEGSAIAYWYQVIATGQRRSGRVPRAAAARMRTAGPSSCGGRWPPMPFSISRTASTREQKEA